MSLMKFRKRLASRRTTQTILWALVVVFVASVFLTGQNMSKNTTSPFFGLFGSGKVIALVNGAKLKADAMSKKYDEQVKQMKSAPDIESAPMIRSSAFKQAMQDLLRDTALKQFHVDMGWFTGSDYAKEYARVWVANSHVEIKKEMEKQQKDAQAPGSTKKALTFNQVASKHYADMIKSMAGGASTVSEPIDDQKFSNWFINKYLLGSTEGGIRDQFLSFVKIQRIGEAYLKSLASPFNDAFANKYYSQEVQASMIFVAAKDNSPQALQEAGKKAQTLYDKVRKDPAKFAEVATADSSDIDTKAKGGSLGWFGAGKGITPQVEFLAFSLKPGDVSMMLPMFKDTYYEKKIGYVIVKTDGFRPLKQPDEQFAADKSLGVLRVRQDLGVKFGSAYLDYQIATANVQCKNEETAIYVAEMHNDVKGANEHRERALQDTSIPEVARAGFAYTLAQSTPDLQKRVTYLQQAVKYAGTAGSSAQISYDLGMAYAGMTPPKNEDALKAFRSAAELAEPSNRQMRVNLLEQFKKLGKAADADVQEMLTWLAANPESPASANHGGMPGQMSMPGQ